MPERFEHRILPNGLTLVAEPDPAAHTAAIGFFVQTGTRDEPRELMGVSHFLEHMLFKGTPRRSAEQVNREFDEIGASYNAWTSHEQTVCHAHVLPEFLPQVTDLLADILRPTLREEDFDAEKKVILEEIAMYEDQPDWRLQDHLHEAYFGDHPLGFRVLGTGGEDGTVAALTAEAMRGYFEQRYRAGNIIVAVAGQVDVARLADQLAQLTAAWLSGEAPRDHTAPMPHAGREMLVDPRVNRHYLAMLSPGPSMQSPDRYAVRVMADALGDADGSHLYWSLVDPGEADEADFAVLPMDHTGCFMAYASCDPDARADVERRLLSVIDTFAEKVTEDEVQRAKAKLATHVTLGAERPEGRMRRLGGQWSFLKEHIALADEVAAIEAVNLGKVKQLAERWLTQPRTVLGLGPAA